MTNNWFKKLILASNSLIGAFIIASGWSWYHFSKHNHGQFVGKALVVMLTVFVGYQTFKKCFKYLVNKTKRHPYWENEFYHQLDRLFLFFSLIFLIYFIRQEIVSMVYAVFILAIIFWYTQKTLSIHPNSAVWKKINTLYFYFFLFIFFINLGFQYWTYHFAVVDTGVKFYNVIVFRAWSITMFWLLLYSITDLAYWQFKKIPSILIKTIWILAFALFLILWSVNAGILFFSGLNLSPIILEHTKGSTGVVINSLSAILLVVLLLLLTIFAFIKRKILLAHQQIQKKYWGYYDLAILILAIFSLIAFSSFKTTPEYNIFKNFYDYFTNSNLPVELNPIVQKKLERFGIKYNLDEFSVNHHDNIFPTTSTVLLPPALQKQQPNILIVFLESYSSRLSEIYNPNLTAVTPGLDKMSKDKNTTIFKKYYNSSTPTVTGLLSQLCSFLPPTGHEEITDGGVRHHHLLCLPKILQNNGYQYSAYITAVDRDFANKGTIITDMGTQKFFGTEELKKYITGEPLSWGWSDHQLFPATWKMMNEQTKQPFLMMLSTVDTHPPFTLAKDMVKYGDGKNNLLNSVHTTDDAFSKFWDEFTNSPLYQNTIVITVADHAIFPTAYTKDYFADVVGKLSFYDENLFMIYVPKSILPKTIDTHSSGIDFTPTVLNLLNINSPNAFEGHSIFNDRQNFPNILGMHEFGLYLNQLDQTGKRMVDYNIPSKLNCSQYKYDTDPAKPLTLCEFLNYYQWKKNIFDNGRFWEN
ncbi:MAG: LTA synthase family protein [Candidatus Magasanikbacteria bacterium]